MRKRLSALLLALPLAALAGPQENFLRIDVQWNDLRLKGDAKALAPLLDDAFVLTHSDGRVQYKADYVGELATRTRTNSGISNEDLKVRLYDRTAVVTGTSVQAGTSDGMPWSGKFRFTRVWVERDGKWTIVASHSSRVTPAP
jgi:ketosteroid isomerase-like protein